MRTLLHLTFHGLGNPPASVGGSERALWVPERAFVEILDDIPADGSVRITFDDGNASDHSVAMRALAERELTATFFLVAAHIGKPGFLDRGQVRELASTGMRIGLHGMEHRSWRGLSQRETERELSDARRILEDLVGMPIDQAACPFGYYDREVLRQLRERGYRRVFTSDRLPARPDDWFQPRYSVQAGDDAAATSRWRREPRLAHLFRRAKVFLKKARGSKMAPRE